MQILVSRLMPQEGIRKLSEYGKVNLFSTAGITYESIACHPDIFMCHTGHQWILAPNIPEQYRILFKNSQLSFRTGQTKVGKLYPDTAHYNAVVGKNFLIHNPKLSDPEILEYCREKKLINVKQGYCRCNIIPLNEENYITSDAGIHKALQEQGLNSLWVEPGEILLPGEKHGFIGGTCGIEGQRIFIAGKLDYLKDGIRIRKLLDKLRFEVIELFEGRLVDVGGMVFFYD